MMLRVIDVEEENDEKDDSVAEDEVEDDDVAEDEVEADDVEDDEVKGEADDGVENDDVEECSGPIPRPRLRPLPTLCELQHCTRANSCRKNPGEMLRTNTGDHTLCEPCGHFTS